MADAEMQINSEAAGKVRCCIVCEKGGTKEKPLKVCAKCKHTDYCSRECQKAHWKQHKLVCNAQKDMKAEKSSDPSSSNVPKGLTAPFAKPFHALNDGKHLLNRPEKDVYQILIDCYRLRIHDDCKFTGDVDEDSIFGGAPNGYAGFRRFLKEANERKSLLPEWWSDEKAEECLGVGQQSGWSDLNSAVEKSDIITHYDNPVMPMQLRLLGAQLIGEASWDSSSARMNAVRIQMAKENGRGGYFYVDMSSGDVTVDMGSLRS